MQNVAKNIVSKGFSNGAGSINACEKKKERYVVSLIRTQEQFKLKLEFI